MNGWPEQTPSRGRIAGVIGWVVVLVVLLFTVATLGPFLVGPGR